MYLSQTSTQDCYLRFDNIERWLQVRIDGHNTKIAQNITIPIRFIDTIEDDDLWILLSLTSPPIFETETSFGRLEDNRKIDKTHLLRTRRTCLIDQLSDSQEPIVAHARVVPYASRFIRLRLSTSDTKEFYRMAEAGKLPRIARLTLSDIDASSRQLFVRKKLELFNSWISAPGFPWEVAFQCQLLLSNGLLNTDEILEQLKPNVIKLLQKDQARCVGILRHFVVVLKGKLDKRDLSLSCSQLFNNAVMEYDRADGLHFLRIISESDHMCSQVNLLPDPPSTYLSNTYEISK